MKISYDEKNRGLLIAFGDPGHYRESREVAPGVVVDFDEAGRPLAIELEDVKAVVDPSEVKKLVHPRISKGRDLRAFRERLNLTQDRLAALIEVPRNTIARWERDEMPIEKARQLELALSALFRPTVQRRFEIVFNEEEGEGYLECGFCGERYGLPFGLEIRSGVLSHDPAHIIREHHDPDISDDTEKVPQCPKWNRWKSVGWEVHDDNSIVFLRGYVRVRNNGEIEVVTSPLESSNQKRMIEKRDLWQFFPDIDMKIERVARKALTQLGRRNSILWAQLGHRRGAGMISGECLELWCVKVADYNDPVFVCRGHADTDATMENKFATAFANL